MSYVATERFPTPPPAPTTRRSRVGGALIALAVVGALLMAGAGFAGGWLSRNGEVGRLSERVSSQASELKNANYALADVRGKLSSAQSQVVQAQDQIASLQQQVRRLSSYGNKAIAVIQAKAACLDVVLDSYNQHLYYEDIGISLENALHSEACRRAGIHF